MVLGEEATIRTASSLCTAVAASMGCSRSVSYFAMTMVMYRYLSKRELGVQLYIVLSIPHYITSNSLTLVGEDSSHDGVVGIGRIVVGHVICRA
jgi:hypothetical protein